MRVSRERSSLGSPHAGSGATARALSVLDMPQRGHGEMQYQRVARGVMQAFAASFCSPRSVWVHEASDNFGAAVGGFVIDHHNLASHCWQALRKRNSRHRDGVGEKFWEGRRRVKRSASGRRAMEGKRYLAVGEIMQQLESSFEALEGLDQELRAVEARNDD
eukprot:1241668-Rhodomonas_salina.1